MTNIVKYCCDFGAVVVALGTAAGYIPIVLGALLSTAGFIYYCLQIYDWIERKRSLKNSDV